MDKSNFSDPTRITTILVVEDEVLISAYLVRVLKRLGYQTLEPVASGEEAVQVCAQQCPDLVLMDIQLAGEMNGIQAAEIIQVGQGLPVVFLSAHTDLAHVNQVMQIEPYGYLSKPVKDSEVRAAVELALYKHHIQKNLKQDVQSLQQTLAEREKELEALKQQLHSQVLENRESERKLALLQDQLQRLQQALRRSGAFPLEMWKVDDSVVH